MAGVFKIVLIFGLAAFALESANALNCTTCFSMTSWDGCQNQSTVVPCSVQWVNSFHEELVDFNPSLQILPESSSNVSFQCFSIELESKIQAPQGESDRAVASGCTFKQQNICDGWTDQARVIKCDTCEAEGICSLKVEENGGGGAGNRVMSSLSAMFVIGVMAFVNVF